MDTKRVDPCAGDPMAIDLAAETERIAAWIRDVVRVQFKKRGAVVAVSGGVDSSVCLALATRALGADRVFALVLPERENSPRSARLGHEVARHLGVATQEHDITAALEGVGCYQSRDEAIRSVFPEYGPGWKNKIAIAGGIEGGFNYFQLVVQDPEGHVSSQRLPHAEYLQVVAAQNHKQRIRKTMDYHHADRLNYAVIGTPNRLEYELGFFVKNGDGAADLKPIAHLFKTQVYAMARYLGLPREICEQAPTTDTYTMPQGQDEFYFALPYPQMDLALWCFHNAVPVEMAATRLGVSPAQAGHVYRDIEAKRSAAAYLLSAPLKIGGEPVGPASPTWRERPGERSAFPRASAQ